MTTETSRIGAGRLRYIYQQGGVWTSPRCVRCQRSEHLSRREKWSYGRDGWVCSRCRHLPAKKETP